MRLAAWRLLYVGFVFLKCEGDYSPLCQGNAVASGVTMLVARTLSVVSRPIFRPRLTFGGEFFHQGLRCKVVRPLFIGGRHCAIPAL